MTFTLASQFHSYLHGTIHLSSVRFGHITFVQLSSWVLVQLSSWVLVLAGLVWYGTTCVMRMHQRFKIEKWKCTGVWFLCALLTTAVAIIRAWQWQTQEDLLQSPDVVRWPAQSTECGVRSCTQYYAEYGSCSVFSAVSGCVGDSAGVPACWCTAVLQHHLASPPAVINSQQYSSTLALIMLDFFECRVDISDNIKSCTIWDSS